MVKEKTGENSPNLLDHHLLTQESQRPETHRWKKRCVTDRRKSESRGRKMAPYLQGKPDKEAADGAADTVEARSRGHVLIQSRFSK